LIPQQLQAIASMEEIISTVSVEQMLSEADALYSAYRGYCLTYIPMGDVVGTQKHFIEMVRSGLISKGMITAPYGYGKTATALSLWFAAEEAKFLAVPPFAMTSLLDILRATYAWAKFRFAESSELVALLDERYKRFAQDSVAGIADAIGEDTGISSTIAKTVLEQLIQQHSVNLKLTANQLFDFLRDTAELAKIGGFRGLVIFPDELQQYFDKDNVVLMNAIQEIRSFVLRLKSAPPASVGISIIFVAPDNTEQKITSMGNDILDRLKEDRLYLNLRTVYDAEFPSKLWQRYGEHFKFDDEQTSLIDLETLRSIGQIAVGKDLGRGPRTVVDCLKLAIQHRYEKGRSYTPIDLVEDFRLGRVAFEGRGSRLRTIVNEVLESKAVDSDDKARAIKLLAAFPRGCEREIWRKYGVETSVDALAKVAHGEHLKYLSEGYTLRRLVEEVGDSNVLVRIIDTHVHQSFSDVDPTFVDKATQAFRTYILQNTFESKRSPGFMNWGNTDFKLTEAGTWLAVMSGSFSEVYPRRILAVQVALDETKCLPPRKEADIHYDFILKWGESAEFEDPGKIQTVTPNHVRFILNLRHRLGERLPSDLRKLDDILSPNQFTPVLMLSLVATLSEWLEKEGSTATPTDQGEARMYIDRLLKHSRNRLFSDGLLTSISPRLNQIEDRCIEELFLRQCKQLFPNYHTLFVQAQYKDVWKEFINGLDQLEPRQRRGVVPIRMNKKEMAALFGLANTTNWDLRVNKALKDVVRNYADSGRGDSSEAILTLKLHPLEETIVEAIENSPLRLPSSKIPAIEPEKLYDVSKENGYRTEEAEIAIELLYHRHILGVDDREGVFYLRSKAIDPDALHDRIEQYRALLKNAPEELVENNVRDRWDRTLQEIEAQIAGSEDESALDDIDYELGEFEQHQWQPYFIERQTSLQERLNNLIFNAERTKQNIGHIADLDNAVTSVLPLAVFLNDFRNSLSAEQRGLLSVSGGYPSVCSPIPANLVINKPSFKSVKDLVEELNRRQKTMLALEARSKQLRERCDQYTSWVRVVRNGDMLYNSLGALPELSKRLVDQVCFRIQQDFNKRKMEALADWEEFQRDIQDIERERDAHFKQGSDEFSNIKTSLENQLRRISSLASPLRSRFEYGAREESYTSLYAEAQERLQIRCAELERRSGEIRQDLLKAEKIQILADDKKPLLIEALKQHQSSISELSRLSSQVNVALFRDSGENLENWISAAEQLVEMITEDIPAKINRLLVRDSTRSPIEQQLWASFSGKRDADLTDLIVHNFNQEGGLTLEEVMNSLITLYRKNQVKITIFRIE